MAAAILVSTFGCNNGLILAGARAYYAMARDGLFFQPAGRLNKAKVPNLWIPKRSIVVENIPVLASGKLDIRRCQELAAQNL